MRDISIGSTEDGLTIRLAMGWPAKELLVIFLQMQYSVDYVWLESSFHVQRKMSFIFIIKVTPVLVRGQGADWRSDFAD